MKSIYYHFYTYILIFKCSLVFSQAHINKGFVFLEEGEFKKAESFFKNYLVNNSNNKTAKLCYGRAVGLNGNPMKAKSIFDELVQQNPENIEFKINAAESLLWLEEYSLALEKYTELYNKEPENPIVLLGLANTYSNLKKFTKAISFYKKVLKRKNITGALVGLAYTYHANNQDDKSLDVIRKVVEKDGDNKEILGLKSKLEKKYNPSISTSYNITSDNGNNSNRHSKIVFDYPIKTKHKISFSYEYSLFKNDKSLEEANQNTIGMEYSIKLKRYLKVFSKLDVLKSTSSNNYSDLNYNLGLELKPFYNHTLILNYEKNYYNFNVELINNKIEQNNISVNYHLLTKPRLGIFSQYMHTFQSDRNRRSLLFNSLYYKFKSKQNFKIGANVSLMNFKEDKSEVYFSPKDYWLTELFAETKLVKYNKKLEMYFNGAYGFQNINNKPSQISYRVGANISYLYQKAFKIKLFSNYSNIASSNQAGFNFSSYGINILYGF